MITIDLLLLVLAFGAFALAALQGVLSTMVPGVAPPRINLLALGLAAWVLSLLI